MRRAVLSLALALALTAPAQAAWEPVGGAVTPEDGRDDVNPRLTAVNGTLHVNFTNLPGEDFHDGLARRFVNGAWQALPAYITYTGGSSSGHGTDIAQVNGTPYVAWIGRPGSETYHRVHVSRFVNGAWQQVGGALNHLNENGRNAKLAVLGSTPCVSFEEYNPSLSGYDVYVKCFEGGAWVLKSPDRVDPSAQNAANAQIAVVAGALVVSWNEDVPGSTGDRIRASRFDGSFWVPLGTGNAITGLTAARSQHHSLADVGGVPHIALTQTDNENTSGYRIRVVRFESGAWSQVGPVVPIDPNARPAELSLAAFNNVPYLALAEQFDITADLRVVRLATAGGLSWQAVGQPLNREGGGRPSGPHLGVLGGMPHIAWSEQEQFGDRKIHVAREVSALANVVRPAITGATAVGGTATCDSGTWSGAPTAYTYTWERTPIGADAWQPILGATAPSYDIAAADAGHQLRCRVRAIRDLEVAEAVSDTITVPAPIVLPPDIPDPSQPPPIPTRDPGVVFVPPTVAATTAPAAANPYAVWVNAMASKPAPGAELVKYEYDTNGDNKPEATCGKNAPAASVPFRRPGTAHIRLTVTDNRGSKASSVLKVQAPQAPVANLPLLVSTCEAPISPFQPSPEDCVKNFAWGMIDVAANSSRKDQCFVLDRDEIPVPVGRSAGIDPGDKPVEGLLPALGASIRGPVKLNGLPIPVPTGIETHYDSIANSIAIGRQGLEIPIPLINKPVNLSELLLTKKVEPDKHGRFELGAAKAQAPGIKALGGLKMGAGATITLLANRSSEVKLSLQLPNLFSFGYGKAMEAGLTVRADNATGFAFEGARMDIPHAYIGPILVEDIFFQYTRTHNQLTGGFNVQLLPGVGPKILASPKDGYGLILRDGAFYEGGFGIRFPPPSPQVFPGINLTEVGADFGVDPLRFTGRLALAAAEVVEIDGTALAVLATRDTPYDYPKEFAPPGTEFLEGRRLDSFSAAIGADLNLRVPVLGKLKIGDAHLFYAYPGLIEAGGNVDHERSLLVGKFSVKGKVGGFVDFESGKFSWEGGITGCVGIKTPKPWPDLPKICLPVGGVLSSKGIGFCGIAQLPLPFPPVPIPVGAGYKWGDAWPDVMVFSCDYGPYKEKNARAAQATRSVELPAGLPAAQIRVTGPGGAAPQLVVTRPNGQAVKLPANDVAMFEEPGGGAMVVALRKPAAGRWQIAAAPGSAISRVQVAEGQDRPRVRARIGGSGDRRTLTYDVAPAEGQVVTFYEKGRRTWARLGEAKGTKGTLTFTPGDGAAETRRIVALVERGDARRHELTVARYGAAGTRRPARPVQVRAERRGSRLTVSWRKVLGAERYAVKVRPRAGVPVGRITRNRRVSVPLARGMRATVEVVALRMDAPPSRIARVTVKAR